MAQNGISARIYSLANGYRELNGLKLIKIKSKGYNLAIMEDYLPVINEIDGDITFIKDNFEEKCTGIHGFYRCAHNEFELIVRSEGKIEQLAD